ncbi:putative LigA [Nocardioidaceae bacterium Broad-1]|nr:putative LigA [Nocardioidaceae bacterium Broad-1]
MAVKGQWMLRLGDYVRGGDIAAIEAMLRSWEGARDNFDGAGKTMLDNAGRVEDGFSETSLSGQAARRDMETSGKETNKKRDVLKDAIDALWIVHAKLYEAMEAHKRLEATLPASHNPVPPESSFNTKAGGGTSTAEAAANQQKYADAKQQYAKDEAVIADAEREAAQRVQAVDVSVEDAEPKVRALYDDGSDSNALPPGTSAQPGSASQVAASQARMSKYNSGTLYSDGWGHELIAQEKANIEAHKAENKPEWNGTEWINADGTPAPSTSYAMVETADGLAPLAGGTGGMSALAIAGGGALLGAGVAKAIAAGSPPERPRRQRPVGSHLSVRPARRSRSLPAPRVPVRVHAAGAGAPVRGAPWRGEPVREAPVPADVGPDAAVLPVAVEPVPPVAAAARRGTRTAARTKSGKPTTPTTGPRPQATS